MQVVLKRIKKTEFDTLKKKVLDKFNANHTIDLDETELDNNSEEVLIAGKQIILEYNMDEYNTIVDSQENTYLKLAKIGMLLHKDTKDKKGTPIPKNVLYEPSVWAYLSFKAFKDVIKKLRLDDDNKMNTDKIERYYFNVKSQKSRRGLIFLWSMIDLLGSENDEEVSTVAFHFIDPVKAVYERAMSKNPAVLKAFVEAIIKNNKDPRIKNKKLKLSIPNNVSCFARINLLDAYQYDELVVTIANQMRNVLEVI